MIRRPMGGAQGQASDIEITAREIKNPNRNSYTIISDQLGPALRKSRARL